MFCARTTSSRLGLGPSASRLALGTLAIAAWPAGGVHAQPPSVVRAEGTASGQAPLLQKIGVEEQLQAQLPLDTQLMDSSGEVVQLGDYFDGERPVVFGFVYHTCPVLCGMVLNAIVDSLKQVEWTVGEDFDLVTVSIDPHDTPERAEARRRDMIARYGRGSAQGWHFLTGGKGAIDSLTSVTGYSYEYDARQGAYAHPAVMMLLTPSGKVGRYLFGIEFNPEDVRFGLLEASQGRSLSAAEHVLIYCYRYDPAAGSYAADAMQIMKLGGALTVVVLSGFIAFMLVRRRKQDQEQEEAARAAKHSGEADGLARGNSTKNDDSVGGVNRAATPRAGNSSSEADTSGRG